MRRNYVKHTHPNPLQRYLLGNFHRTLLRLVERALKQEARPRVLDVGCGEGFVSHFLWRQKPNLQLMGVDSCHEALAYAFLNGGSPSFRADAHRLPFAEGAFPLVLCLEVLEHLEDPWRALEELKRVSAAHLIVSVPNQPFFALANCLRGKNWRTLGDDPEHRHHWTGPAFLASLSERARVLEVAYPFPWVMALAAR